MAGTMKGLYPPDILLSPSQAIIRINELVRIYGKDRVYRESRFKKEREGAVTALFLLGFGLLEPETFWISLGQPDPPDTMAVFYKRRASDRGLEKHVRNIEIFEWEEHSSVKFVEAVQNKLLLKKYPKDFTLLCNVRRPGENGTFEEWFKVLEKLKLNVAEVWVVGSIVDSQDDYGIFRLYPTRSHTTFNLNTRLREIEHQPAYMREMGRGIMDEPKALGKYRIPLP
ncbi:MAG: hypothetical protein IPP09_03990 [Elusimicrobia bacterium]|nr:hypothetical protein [Elusimicrobiota bacterium]